MRDVLAEICAEKRAHVARAKAVRSEAALLAGISEAPPVQPFAAAFSLVDPRLVEASSVLGASKLRTFFRVVLPLSVPGVVTGIALSFAHTMGEFGVVLMIGGNIPGATQTVSIWIYDQVQSLNYAAANRMAVLLLIVCFVVLTLLYGLRRNRKWGVWGWQ